MKRHYSIYWATKQAAMNGATSARLPKGSGYCLSCKSPEIRKKGTGFEVWEV